jgi:hypothetical protein
MIFLTVGDGMEVFPEISDPDFGTNWARKNGGAPNGIADCWWWDFMRIADWIWNMCKAFLDVSFIAFFGDC